MTYEEFAEMSDRVFWMMDLRKAAEEDDKAMQEKENLHKQPR